MIKTHRTGSFKRHYHSLINRQIHKKHEFIRNCWVGTKQIHKRVVPLQVQCKNLSSALITNISGAKSIEKSALGVYHVCSLMGSRQNIFIKTRCFWTWLCCLLRAQFRQIVLKKTKSLQDGNAEKNHKYVFIHIKYDCFHHFWVLYVFMLIIVQSHYLNDMLNSNSIVISCESRHLCTSCKLLPIWSFKCSFSIRLLSLYLPM